MRKLIAAINMTLDGYCDHTAMMADAQLHEHYTELLKNAGAILYGRTTYQLMEDFWPHVAKNPTGTRDLDDFAVAMENAPKIVFSRTLNQVNWSSAKLATGDLKEEIMSLKRQPGKDLFVGSPSLIMQCLNLDLVDEYQLCVHPVIAGKGLPLFKEAKGMSHLKLMKTKSFDSGAITLYYESVKK
jgi:dihydrofolate reductase